MFECLRADLIKFTLGPTHRYSLESDGQGKTTGSEGEQKLVR